MRHTSPSPCGNPGILACPAFFGSPPPERRRDRQPASHGQDREGGKGYGLSEGVPEVAGQRRADGGGAGGAGGHRRR